MDRFWNLDLSFTDEFMRDKYSVFGPKPRTPSCMQRSYLLSIDFKVTSLTDWAAQLKINPLYAILSGFEFGDTPGVGTFYDFLNRLWDSDDKHLSPHIHPLKAKVKKPKTKGGIKLPYKNDFIIGKDGVPVCREGRRMNHDGSEPSKYRGKFRCPLASRKYGCSCEHPFSDSKYGRTVHVAMKDNPRLFNIPSRDTDEWKLEYHARTSAERSNKREKVDFKLEDGRHRSTKMWYCRFYHILMLQHLDAWDMPFESALRKLILQAA